jgi:hypothetical protein
MGAAGRGKCWIPPTTAALKATVTTTTGKTTTRDLRAAPAEAVIATPTAVTNHLPAPRRRTRVTLTSASIRATALAVSSTTNGMTIAGRRRVGAGTMTTTGTTIASRRRAAAGTMTTIGMTIAGRCRAAVGTMTTIGMTTAGRCRAGLGSMTTTIGVRPAVPVAHAISMSASIRATMRVASSNPDRLRPTVAAAMTMTTIGARRAVPLTHPRARAISTSVSISAIAGDGSSTTMITTMTAACRAAGAMTTTIILAVRHGRAISTSASTRETMKAGSSKARDGGVDRVCARPSTSVRSQVPWPSNPSTTFSPTF